MTLIELNALPADRAAAEFLRCCGSVRWAERMTRARPFRDLEALSVTADVIWKALHPDDWREAFAAHPRIGERGAGRAGGAGGAGGADDWAAREQAGAAGGAEAVRSGLAELNRAYEARFGYIFIICATGKTAPEMLGALKSRLSNDFEQELPVAAEEQRQITRLRLAKLLDR